MKLSHEIRTFELSKVEGDLTITRSYVVSEYDDMATVTTFYSEKDGQEGDVEKKIAKASVLPDITSMIAEHGFALVDVQDHDEPDPSPY